MSIIHSDLRDKNKFQTCTVTPRNNLESNLGDSMELSSKFLRSPKGSAYKITSEAF